MVWPVPGVAVPSSAKLSWGNQRATHTHNGQDIPAREGTPVVAAAGGRVTHAAPQWAQGFSGYGGHVVVAVPSSPPEWHLYAHLAAVDVEPGAVVATGQRIGTVGRTAGTPTDPSALFAAGGAHLHFERSPRPYPLANTAPRLDPAPAWGVPMRSLAELSQLFTELRGAAVDRAGKLRPGVAPEAAARALQLADRFRVWADGSAPGLRDKPAVYRDAEYQRWEREYMAMRAELGGAAAAKLPEIDPEEKPGALPELERGVERVLGAAGAALLALGALYILLNSRRGS